MSVGHITGSKQLVSILNRMGHCSSYDEIESVDTGIAKEILAKSQDCGTVIPSNILPGAFIQFAADNNDLNEDTLDAKSTTHATTRISEETVRADASAKRACRPRRKIEISYKD